ncbi:unnamed protein product [Kuraishia capsulata CBS 1993]|uniref:Kelch motif family protein n=1 Tax=Kuraishia capsulata CBS 1993 TaxID=1382522 RepID=W6MFC8_9ASCO|nr:uncharacterized protein KUCA_T00000437001 [Kuraishia capsulata CBS 1993]CDK24474.1 unnamed protein product [Kuraishia capsulata CBS 1993]
MQGPPTYAEAHRPWVSTKAEKFYPIGNKRHPFVNKLVLLNSPFPLLGFKIALAGSTSERQLKSRDLYMKCWTGRTEKVSSVNLLQYDQDLRLFEFCPMSQRGSESIGEANAHSKGQVNQVSVDQNWRLKSEIHDEANEVFKQVNCQAITKYTAKYRDRECFFGLDPDLNVWALDVCKNDEDKLVCGTLRQIPVIQKTQTSTFRLTKKARSPTGLVKYGAIVIPDYDTREARIYLYGGYDAAQHKFCSEIWRFDCTSGKWKEQAYKDTKLGSLINPVLNIFTLQTGSRVMTIFGGEYMDSKEHKVTNSNRISFVNLSTMKTYFLDGSTFGMANHMSMKRLNHDIVLLPNFKFLYVSGEFGTSDENPPKYDDLKNFPIGYCYELDINKAITIDPLFRQLTR